MWFKRDIPSEMSWIYSMLIWPNHVGFWMFDAYYVSLVSFIQIFQALNVWCPCVWSGHHWPPLKLCKLRPGKAIGQTWNTSCFGWANLWKSMSNMEDIWKWWQNRGTSLHHGWYLSFRQPNVLHHVFLKPCHSNTWVFGLRPIPLFLGFRFIHAHFMLSFGSGQVPCSKSSVGSSHSSQILPANCSEVFWLNSKVFQVAPDVHIYHIVTYSIQLCFIDMHIHKESQICTTYSYI